MTIKIKNKALFLKEGVTEGTSVVSSVAASDFACFKTFESKGTRTVTDTEEVCGDAVSVSPNVNGGIESVEASASFLLKSGDAAGDRPRVAPLWEWHGNQVEDFAAIIADDTNVAHSTTIMGIGDAVAAEVAKLSVGDALVMDVNGIDHPSTVKSFDATPGNVFIEFEDVAPFAMVDGDSIFDCTIIRPSASVSKFGDIGQRLLKDDASFLTHYVTSAKVSEISISNVERNAVPEVAFTLSGLADSRDSGDTTSLAGADPSFESATGQAVRDSFGYYNASPICAKTFELTLGHESGSITDICQPDQLAGIRQGGISCEGSFSLPEYDVLTYYSDFDDGSNNRMVMGLRSKTAVANVYDEYKIFSTPNIQITDESIPDGELVVEENMTFRGNSGDNKDTSVWSVTFVTK
jgi:hypothetical protein